MKTLKRIIAKNFENLAYFYRHLKGKIFVALFLNVTVGILDGFGLAMFLPLLQMVGGQGNVHADKMGNLGFLVNWLHGMGVDLTLGKVLFIIVLFFIGKGFSYYIRGVYQVKVQQHFIKKIRISNVRNLNGLSYKYFVTSDVGRIQNTLTGEVDRVSRAYQFYFQAFQMGIMVFVYMAFAFFVDWKFAIMVSIGGAASNFLYKEIYKSTRGRSHKLTLDSNQFQGLVTQEVANFKYLKASGKLADYSDRLVNQVEHIEQNNLRIGILGVILLASREPLIILVVCSVILLQTVVLGSPLSVILISLLFFYRALNALMYMQQGWNAYLGVSGSLVNMTDFTNDLRKNQEKTGKVVVDAFRHEISLEKAAFKYGDRYILKDINLKVRKNETLAFVGESGSGKTTLINILCGLLPLDEGEMRVDGIAREQLDITCFQKRIGYITQDPVIFNDSIYNNVTFWAEKSPENLEKFREACRKAAILNFIESLSDQEETGLGNNGINLSGGQKQRISIARELFKDIDILILDEATSALDSETENEIQENIDALRGQFTLLIIAHRLSTVRYADNIVFLKSGKIIMIDDFTGLAREVPEFKKMAELQEMI